MDQTLRVGDTVRITKGIFASYYGKVLSLDNKGRRLTAVGKFLVQPDTNEHMLNVSLYVVEKLGGASGKRNVLLIDADEAVHQLAQEVFGPSAYQLIPVASSGAAVLVSEYYQGPIHLLITDVVLIEISGPEVASRLKKVRPYLKVIFTSDYSEDVLHNRGLIREEPNFLPKPFTGDVLMHKVNEVLKESHGHR